MRIMRVVAAAAVAAALAVPGVALAARTGPIAGPTALTIDGGVPVGSLWDVGGTPACRAVSVPPAAPAGAARILVGAPGQPDQFCGGYARVEASGAVTLPGGIPGERLSPSAYAAQTGQGVVVAYRPGGGVIVYLSS